MAYSAQAHQQQMVYACPHYDIPVRVESQVVMPSDFFREMPQRITRRTCSHEFDCFLLDKSACPMKLLQIRKQTLN